MLLQVILERGKACHQGTAFAERAQAHVHTKHKTVLVPEVEQPDELTAESIEIFLVFNFARSTGLTRLREQEHEVDVRREIQFAAAELAHAQHDQRHFLTLPVARRAEHRLKMQARRSGRGPDARIREV